MPSDMAFAGLGLRGVPSFGVAGNFTGHLEQAGEAADFAAVRPAEEGAPKALFPTYIPGAAAGAARTAGPVPSAPSLPAAGPAAVPPFLRVFPFDSRTIVFPKGEERLQMEPECAVLFSVGWEGGLVASLSPLCFAASNDCSIRRAGARKISEKKNWGPCSKGLADHAIALGAFTRGCALDGYRIASFLVRGGEAFAYGEDSPVAGYSYIWEKLSSWIVDRLNFQKDEGPAEDVHAYLTAGMQGGLPGRVLVSIGATRYTDWGERNFLRGGDEAVVVLYPEGRYSADEIRRRVEARDLGGGDISALRQTVRA